MQKKWLLTRAFVIAITALFFTLATGPTFAQHAKTPGQLKSTANRNDRQVEALKEEIRHQLVTLPYYSVFDWLQAEVKPDGTVRFMGEVTRPTIKDDAEKRAQAFFDCSKRDYTTPVVCRASDPTNAFMSDKGRGGMGGGRSEELAWVRPGRPHAEDIRRAPHTRCRLRCGPPARSPAGS